LGVGKSAISTAIMSGAAGGVSNTLSLLFICLLSFPFSCCSSELILHFFGVYRTII
jgi:hypothetical protein